ncbi:MAG TPA: glycosyltransferase family 4 protein [Ignavibacteria bacterium]|nr:glycosyltransferase family 4 protein [Ignavibacteria bacterium]
MKDKKKILFIKNLYQNPKFITNDLEILSKQYDVKLLNFKSRRNALIIFSLMYQFFYLLFNIWKFDLVYIWFADYLSFYPVLFSKLAGKKSIICAGGYEATYIPEINMGVFTNASISKKVRAFCVRYSLKNCTCILPVDETLIEHTNNYIYSDIPGKAPLRDGIKHFIPGIKTEFRTMYLGYDSDFFRKSDNIIKERSVVSAGLIVNDDEFRRKGFDLLIEAAAEMPEVKFVLIGFDEQHLSKLKNSVTPNVELHGKVPYAKLVEEYSKAKVYAQFSMFEGMPSSICEAMLCECIPVGSDVNGIPKIINGCGYVISKKDTADVRDTILKALDQTEVFAAKARQHIILNFNYSNREKNLLQLVKSIL